MVNYRSIHYFPSDKFLKFFFDVKNSNKNLSKLIYIYKIFKSDKPYLNLFYIHS